jgi:hypothetical protein
VREPCVATWKYLNPGDTFELHVLVAGIDDPRDVEIGVDAEGADIQEHRSLEKAIQAVLRAGQEPMSEPTLTASPTRRS